jgi:hypothetical protein
MNVVYKGTFLKAIVKNPLFFIQKKTNPILRKISK